MDGWIFKKGATGVERVTGWGEAAPPDLGPPAGVRVPSRPTTTTHTETDA